MRRWLQEAGLKAFALLLAVLLWFSARFYARDDAQRASLKQRPSARREFQARPVLLLRAGTDARSVSVEPGLVDVTIRGDAGVVDRLSAEDITAFVRVEPGLGDGVGTRPVEFVMPPGVAEARSIPARVQYRAQPAGP
jgi:hypothetical protein